MTLALLGVALGCGILVTVLSVLLDQPQRPDDVVVVVGGRLRHRLGHHDLGGEVGEGEATG